jgi:methylated-DNA-[protein]-cysteine S-methyltransferase
MNELVVEARERLFARAKREGLASVGYGTTDSPLGPLWIAVGPRGVAIIEYGDDADPRALQRLVDVYGPGILPDARAIAPVARELDEYFAGKRRRFDIDVDLSGLTPFQRRILSATARVPFGELATYGAVAARAGNPAAARAAGGALGANPIPIVVPCHRIVASDGTLGGYMSGLARKRKLLEHERGTVPRGGWPPSKRH